MYIYQAACLTYWAKSARHHTLPLRLQSRQKQSGQTLPQHSSPTWPQTHIYFSLLTIAPKSSHQAMSVYTKAWACMCVLVWGHPVWMAGEILRTIWLKKQCLNDKRECSGLQVPPSSMLTRVDSSALLFLCLMLLFSDALAHVYSLVFYGPKTSRYILFSITRALLVEMTSWSSCCSTVHSRAEWYVPWGLSDGHKGSIQNGVKYS